MRRVRALGIAPYDGLAIQLRNEARKRSDIDIDVYTGDLEDGVAIAQRRFSDGYDVIISRGGTAELLEARGFPVIDISISLYDILRSLRLADDAKKKYAIIGFPTITKNAVFLKEVLSNGMDIEVITTGSAEESEEAMKRLRQEGVTNIVCDMTGARMARTYKLNFILINSASESISAALDMAVKLGRQRVERDGLIKSFFGIVDGCPNPIVVFTSAGIANPDKTRDMPEGFLNAMKQNAAALKPGDVSSLDYDDYGTLYSAIGRKLDAGGNPLAAYYIRRTRFPFILEESGISVRNSRRATIEYEKSFFAVTNASAREIDILDSFAERDYPVMIIGEPGTGKGPLSQYLYISSKHSGEPLYDIDCGIAGKRTPEFIRTLYRNAPELKAVFNLKNISELDADTVDELIELNEEYKLGSRAYIIASATIHRAEPLVAPCLKFINRLQCMTLTTTPLREHIDDIASIANIYINFINRTQGSSVLTIDERAFEIMRRHDWPYNNDELARILRRLTASAGHDVITADDMSAAIAEEKRLYAPAERSFRYDGRSLKEIERDIAEAVLEEEDGNRTVTARKLGVSRSTLWRMLQNE